MMSVMTKALELNEVSVLESRREQLFPILQQRHLEVLKPYGKCRRYATGDILFRAGERHIPMFVIVSGAVDILRDTLEGQKIIVTYKAGMFTGEISLLAGRAAVVTGRARNDCEVLVINDQSLRALVVEHAELSEIVMRAFILRRVALIQDHASSIIVLGSQHSGDTLRLREFLTRNGQPFTYFDVELDIETAALQEKFAITNKQLPVVLCGQGTLLQNPSNRLLADTIGVGPECLRGKEFDVVVAGAGPAGLAAAVYAASEGLKVAVLDIKAPGGQAGTSSKIENYFGFPTGISGQALAGRGFVQAQKFGTEVAIPVEVKRLDCTDGILSIEIDDGERLTARAIVIATGARYRKPSLPNLEKFEGNGIYYGASFTEAILCKNQEAIVVGGGNSAGQAAVFLSTHARNVHMLIRGKGLAASMSHYLIQRINAASNITLHTETEIVELVGEDSLERIKWRHRNDPVEEQPIRHAFMFLGADPNTTWLGDCVALDDKGFVLTGTALMQSAFAEKGRALEHLPAALETSRPGVFAVGDVRSGSVKRVASAVGEGAAAVQSLHAFLDTH
jgi:thioredoxin reductase (NADPH)